MNKYIKARITEIIKDGNQIKVKLEGTNGFLLKMENYKDITKFIKFENEQKVKADLHDCNIFIKNEVEKQKANDKDDNIIELKNSDNMFNIDDELCSFIPTIFIINCAYIFTINNGTTIDNNDTIIAIRKCN